MKEWMTSRLLMAVNRAVDEADFDLEKFPKIPGDGS
jgi:hypothetical protein